MRNATRSSQPTAMQPFAIWNPTRGAWETSQLDLSGQPAPYSAIWPTSGWMHDGSVYQLPSSAHPITAIASSSLPIAGTLFRTPLASDSARGSETLDQVRARRGTIALSHQVIDIALNGPPGSRAKYNESETLWSLIQSIFDAGGIRPCDSPLGAHHRTTSPITDAPERHGRSEAVAGVCGVAHGPPIWMG
jgi:hypothetical protein